MSGLWDLKVKLRLLKARRQKALEYILNRNLMLEAEMLTAEIEELKKIIKENS